MKDHPDWILYGSETSSTVSSRGVYHLPIERYQRKDDLQVTSYDIIAPAWATQPDAEFIAQDKFPNVLGEFVWTGFDYLGEPTPYLVGRGRRYQQQLAQPQFLLRHRGPGRLPEGSLLPLPEPLDHQADGPPAAALELGRNGRQADPGGGLHELRRGGADPQREIAGSEETVQRAGGSSRRPEREQGWKLTSKYRLMWEVPYQPGSSRWWDTQGGKQAAVHEIRTAGAPARITLLPDRGTILPRRDLSFVTVRVEDKDGNFCPLADNLVKFKLSGPGKIAAVDNGNAATVEPFQADHRKAFQRHGAVDCPLNQASRAHPDRRRGGRPGGRSSRRHDHQKG